MTEHRFDVLRNNSDLYGSIYYVISLLAAYNQGNCILGEDVPGYYQTRNLCKIAAKILPQLPAPADNANVW